MTFPPTATSLRKNWSKRGATIESSPRTTAANVSAPLGVQLGGGGHLHQLPLQVGAALPVLPGEGSPPRAHLLPERAEGARWAS